MKGDKLYQLENFNLLVITPRGDSFRSAKGQELQAKVTITYFTSLASLI